MGKNNVSRVPLFELAVSGRSGLKRISYLEYKNDEIRNAMDFTIVCNDFLKNICLRLQYYYMSVYGYFEVFYFYILITWMRTQNIEAE